MICNAWDVVVVPFPFTDMAAEKKRPAIVLSQTPFNRRGFSIMAMVTTAAPSWPGDVSLADLKSAGLSAACLVRLKLFTLDNRLILRKCGVVAVHDQQNVKVALMSVLGETLKPFPALREKKDRS